MCKKLKTFHDNNNTIGTRIFLYGLRFTEAPLIFKIQVHTLLLDLRNLEVDVI